MHRAADPRPAATPLGAFNYSVVNYTASSDGFPLSYEEWLPDNYSASQNYPLIVYLHGMQGFGLWKPGGVLSEITTLLSNTTYEGTALQEFFDTGASLGYLMMTINERSGAGFYINSRCGGPEAQDTLDAIAHEEALRHVASVYLVGFSMGSVGAFYLASTHPGMFAGIAVAGTITDLFSAVHLRQEHQYDTTGNWSWANDSYRTMLGFACRTPPGAGNATIDALFRALSPARLDPTAFANLPMYVVAGGEDDRAPNNATFDAYFQVNNTFVNSTCLTYPGEPDNCTVPFAALHAQDPGAYDFREVYEPVAGHTYGDLNATDVFAWFAGQRASGFYVADHYPPTEILPAAPSELQLVGPGPFLSASSSTNLTEVNGTVTFSANASGLGGPSYSYDWEASDGWTTSGSTAQHTFLRPGNFSVSVTSPGLAGGITNLTLPSIHVVALLSPSFAVPAGTVETATMVNLTAVFNGGVGPYSCLWKLGDGSEALGCSVAHAWLQAGSYTVQLQVTDSLGHEANYSQTLSIASPELTPSSGPRSPAWLLVALGLTSAVVIVLAVLVVRQRKRPKDPRTTAR